MNTKIILGVVVVVALAGAGYFFMSGSAVAPTETDNQRMGEMPTETGGKLKVANFEGTLEEVNTGCYADGECYVVVDGKHITTLMGWSRDIVGVADFDELYESIGQTVEVYANDKGDGTFTLYGSESFYVRLK